MLCQKLAKSTQLLRGEEGVLFFGEEGCLSVFKGNLCKEKYQTGINYITDIHVCQ